MSAYELAFFQVFHRLSFPDNQERAQINLTLGPHGSYFTMATRKGLLWRNLPQDLADEIEASEIGAPCHVALGYNQTWVCLWQDHTFSWNLKDKSPNLSAKLQKYKDVKNTIALVALSPYQDSGAWVLVDCDGFIDHSFINMNMSESVSAGIQQMAVDYMQRRVRKTGISIHNKWSWGDREVKSVIGPNTPLDVRPLFGIRRLYPLTQHFHSARARLPQRLRRPDAVTSASVGLCTALTCSSFGLKLGPALGAGAVAGMVTFAIITPQNLF